MNIFLVAVLSERKEIEVIQILLYKVFEAKITTEQFVVYASNFNLYVEIGRFGRHGIWLFFWSCKSSVTVFE